MSDGVWAAVYMAESREAHYIQDGIARCGLETLWAPAPMAGDGTSEWVPCPICLDAERRRR